jgi:hypothetical protein
MDIVGFPVDSFATKFVLCTKTKVGLATQGKHSIPGKTRRPLIVGGVFGGVCTWKPILLFLLVTLLHIWFDQFFQTGSGQSHISTICVHGAILEVRTIHKHVHEIVVKLQHPELGVLVDKTANLHGYIQSNGLHAHLHFEGLGTQLVTATEGRVDEIAADLMLLTVNDVCVSLFVGDCFPIAGISIKLAGLGHAEFH